MAAMSQPMTADPSQHRQELIDRLDTLRKNESFFDVAVAAKGKEFKAHKVVLAAASPFFLSLLESGMRESNEQLIRIELEETTASVMEDVLKYVYTGNVVVTEESAHNLIATADYLLLPGLKALACNFLKEVVTTENCVFIYYFADKYQCVELKEKSFEVIKSNFSVVLKTGDFLNLDAKQVMDWVSSDDVTVSAEEEVFFGIVKWVSHNKSKREKDFPDLLHEVRLRSISHDFLLNTLVKEELITTNIECLNFVLAAMKWIFIPPDTECALKPPRKCLEMHTDGIFVCGGRKALCYLPQKNVWYQLADMILEHQDHSVVQFGDKIYSFNKQQVGPGKSDVMEYYIPASNSCGTFQANFFDVGEKHFSSLSVMNGGVYAVESQIFGLAFIYYPDKNNWDLLSAPHERIGTCIVADGKHLYIIGGTADWSWMGTTAVERYDPSNGSWEDVAAMNEARHDAFGAAMNGKIYVAGGYQKKDQTDLVISTCEVYSPSTNQWQLMPSLNVPRYSASMVCFNGTLYVVGGLKNYEPPRELSVEMFDSEINEWKEKSTIPVSQENQEERKKHYHYKACFAKMNSNALNKPIA